MATLLETKAKVQQYLTTLGTVTIDSDGDFSLRHESARIFVSVGEFGDDNTVVEIFALVLQEVPLTPALYEYVATQNTYRFGKLSVAKAQDGVSGRLMLGHSLLGNTLDQEELVAPVVMLANLANELDDELQSTVRGLAVPRGLTLRDAR